MRVPAVGPRDAKIAFVGEAPGAEEEKLGEPFVGTSGQLFRNTMSRVGIPPGRVFITNTCKERPPNNDISKWAKQRKRKGTKEYDIIPNETVARGIHALYAELAELRRNGCNVVVPLGNTALWALTGQQHITKRRGSIMAVEWDLNRARIFQDTGFLTEDFMLDIAAVQGMKVIPTIHPAAVLRLWSYMAPFQTDLRRIKEDSTFPELRLPEREIILNPQGKILDEAVKELLGAKELSFDIESVGNRLYCTGFASDPKWALTLSANSPENDRAVRTLLTSPIPKIAQNALFDTTFLPMYAGIHVNNLFFDTMLAQHACYPELPKGLDFLCSVFTREPYYKDEGKNWSQSDAEDVERFLTYNAKDTASTLEISIAQRAGELQDPNYRQTFERIMTQLPAYRDMMLQGIRVDRRRQAFYAKKYEEDIVNFQAELDKAALRHLAEMMQAYEQKGYADKAKEIREFIVKILPGQGTLKGALNVNSSAIVMSYLYDIRGMKEKTTRKGRASIRTANEDALKELFAETHDPFLLTIVKIRQHRKRLSSYLGVTSDGSGRTYFSVNPAGAKTGRSSMGKTVTGYGLNFQTIPHAKFPGDDNLRDMYIPDPGCLFGYLDLNQAEARIVAYKAGIERMIQAFESPQVKYTESDVHSLTAHGVLGIPYEGMQEFPHRYMGKRCNHAFNYEMGPEKFYKVVNRDSADTGVSISRKEAKEYRKRHLQLYPQLLWYWEDIRAQLRRNRTLINPMGRKRIFLGRLGDDTFREAFSHYAQSTVADVLRTGMAVAHRDVIGFYRAGGEDRVRIVLEVHDALLIQAPRDIFDEVMTKVMRAMTIPFSIDGREITIPVGAEQGENWGDMEHWHGEAS